MPAPIKIGVSACLLGEHVRYDGGHKHDRCITDTLGEYFSFIPVCPEVGAGMPTPREAMQLEGKLSGPRLMTLHTRIDMTGQMLSYCSSKLDELEAASLCGFIFKERSPSCGLAMVPLHVNSFSEVFVSGLFANEFIRRFPLIPRVEAEQLNRPGIRSEFVERVFLYNRMRYATACESCVGHPLQKPEF